MKKLTRGYAILETWTEVEYWCGQVFNINIKQKENLLLYVKALSINGKCDLAKEFAKFYSDHYTDGNSQKLISKYCKKDELILLK